jgi:type IV secretory pathway TrbL component
MWSLDDRAATSGHGWLEAARRASLAGLVAGHHAPGAAAEAGAGMAEAGQATGAGGTAAGASPRQAAVSWDQRGGIDDDEHLAAYNAFLARLNQAETGREQ